MENALVNSGIYKSENHVENWTKAIADRADKSLTADSSGLYRELAISLAAARNLRPFLRLDPLTAGLAGSEASKSASVESNAGSAACK